MYMIFSETPSISDTLGTTLSSLIKGGVLILGVVCTLLYVAWEHAKCPKVTKSCVMLSALLSIALVPDAPQVNVIPVYSSESQALTNLMIEIHSQMVRVCLNEI